MVAVQSRLNDTNEYCKQKEQVLHTEIAFSYHPLSFLTTFFRLLSSVYSLLSLITSTLLLVLIHLSITIPISVILLSSPFHYYASFQKPTYIPVLLLIHFFHPPLSPPLSSPLPHLYFSSSLWYHLSYPFPSFSSSFFLSISLLSLIYTSLLFSHPTFPLLSILLPLSISQ